jgi:hypothetical protein
VRQNAWHSAKRFASYRHSNQEVCTLGCH